MATTNLRLIQVFGKHLKVNQTTKKYGFATSASLLNTDSSNLPTHTGQVNKSFIMDMCKLR